MKQKIGLALGSGGPRGLAHIGVIKALVESGIHIDAIAGSSAGALIGGVYAALGSTSKLEELVQSLTYKNLAMLFLDLGATSGIIRGKNIEKYLATIVSTSTIESLRIPFAAVATDLSTGMPVVLNSGELSKVIRASSSIPAFFDAVKLNGRMLVDGGASMPVPVAVVRDLGATYCIAVNLDVYTFIQPERTKTIHVAHMGKAALDFLRFNLAQTLASQADYTIIPDVSRISSLNLMEFMHGEGIIQKGYEAGRAAIPHILQSLHK